MLSGLSHNTIGCCYYKDSAIHLSCTGDHVLNVVSMSWAVNVCIVSLLSLILNVCGRNGDTTLSLLRSLIDVLEIGSGVTSNSLSQNFGDCCGQSGFTMVNVADGTNVTMRFGSFKLCFCHFITSSLICPPSTGD